jgi:hypothetical protein
VNGSEQLAFEKMAVLEDYRAKYNRLERQRPDR